MGALNDDGVHDNVPFHCYSSELASARSEPSDGSFHNATHLFSIHRPATHVGAMLAPPPPRCRRYKPSPFVDLHCAKQGARGQRARPSGGGCWGLVG